MKLIVDDPINLPAKDVDVNLLKELRVMSQESGPWITIIPQKICLDEVSMNALFSECIVFGDAFTLQFANVGGPGCEMALSIKK